MRLVQVIAVALLVWARPARADDDAPSKPSYRILVDRLEHEPAAITGTRLRIHLSALTLQGQRLDLTDPKTIQTYVGPSQLKAPYALGTFGATDAALAVVLVVQATLDYQEVLPVLAETLEPALLSKLADDTQIALLAYGEATGTGKLGPLKSVRGKLAQLQDDGTAGDPALLETVERALLLLKKAKAEPAGRALRKLIVVIADGRDRAGDRERVTRLGLRAAKEGVRIHTLAHSPTDQRRPLLLLGELSRRSLGTFRWLQRGKADSWTPAFEQLQEEITGQYVLTYFLDADQDPAGKRLRVTTVGRTEATSEDRQPDLKVPPARCAGEPCAGYCTGTRCVVVRDDGGRGVLGWILLIGGIGVGALVGLGVLGYVLTARQHRRAHPLAPPPPGATPGAAPGALPGAGHPAWRGAPAPAPVPPRAVPHLLFVSGPRAGERIPLRHGFLIGKAPGCDLLLDDSYASSHHAQIGMDHAGACRLYDRGSTNGTYLNGARVTDAALEHGASIRVGSTELRFLAQ